MRVWRDLNLDAMPIPRPVWFFEETRVQVGVEIANGYTDPVASLSVAFDLSARMADRLCSLLDAVGAVVCRIVGHKYEPMSYPKNTPENPRDHLYFDHEQCVRCRDWREAA